MRSYKYVILGGGLAAGYAAQEFAASGVEPGMVCIVSDEHTLPYERPPLSKDFLAGEETAEDILINDPDFYEENGITVLLNHRVDRVDLEAKQLHADGEAIAFDKLLIATGSHLNRLDAPGAQLDNIFYLRRIDDSRAIRRAAQEAKRAVVVGGSFIGMEVTSVLQDAGVETTMVFPQDRVWASFFTPEMSQFFENYYRERGVTFVKGQTAQSFEGDDDGRVARVVLASGEKLDADLVVLGIGVAPNVALFQDSPLHVDDGIVVNRFLETNMPDVFAAGDVARYHDVIYDQPRHIEHWDNAYSQGQHAAQVMTGRYEPFVHVPYFFSDVFDLSYEFWGDTAEADEVVHRGDVATGSFSTWWLKDGRLQAAFVMDRPEEERELAPQWIKSGVRLSAEALADEDEPLRPVEEDTAVAEA